MDEKKQKIVCFTFLVETSPQALPMGAACIASAIKNNALTSNCFEAELLHFSREDEFYTDDDAAASFAASEILKRSNLTAVAFSVYVWNRTVMEKTAAIIHKKNSSILCIAGGPEVTADPLSFANFDFLVSGEGECSVPELFSKVLLEKASCNLQTEVPGYAFGIQGVYRNTTTEAKESKTGLLGFKGQKVEPLSIVRSVVPEPAKLSSPWLDGTLDAVPFSGVLWELARGCPFKCSYCYESKGEKKIQYFPMERLERELELFASKNIPQAFVLDPTYNASKKRALEMLNIIKKKAPKMFFYFEARAEFIDRELAQAFASVNCSLQFGLQSADPEVLKKVNRTLDKKLFTRNIGFLNSAGAVFGFDLIYGLPGDTYSGFKNSIDFALSLYPNNLELFCLSVLPGTTLYEQGTDLGLTWEAQTPYHVVETTTFPQSELQRSARLSAAVNFFYNQGRAVPWFNTILKVLKQKPSVFFTDFVKYSESQKITLENCSDFNMILKVQMEYIRRCLEFRHLERMSHCALDLIQMNAAISECTASGKESEVKLHYHPDDLMSEYSFDLVFFAANVRPHGCTVRVFSGKNGVDWKVKQK